MGSSGWSLPLTPIKGRKPPTDDAVREAIVPALCEAFGDLPSGYDRQAQRWISLGEDSLLAVQDPDAGSARATELRFWFNASVDWPSDLAGHWLRLAMAAHRVQLEQILASLGVAIAGKHWPALGPDKLRFVTHEDRVGLVRDPIVRWQLAATGAASGETEVAALPEELRAQIASGHCLCPMCERLSDLLRPPITARPGVHLERVFSSTFRRWFVAPRRGGHVAIGGAWRFSSWAAHTTGDGAWNTIDALTDRERDVDVLHEVGAEVVALLGYGSPSPPRVASVSRDGGATWSKPAATKLPAVPSPRFLRDPGTPGRVFVQSGNGKELYRSDDGGRTFGKKIAPKLAGKSPNSIRELLACGGRLVAQWRKTRKAKTTVAVSDDDGNTFTPVKLGNDPDTGVGVWGTTSGSVVVFAKRAGTERMLITSDGARTWTERDAPFSPSVAWLGGRWFAAASDDGLYASDDEGATWTKLVDGDIEEVFPDGADPASCYIGTASAVLHVVGAGARKPARRQLPHHARKPPR